MRRGLGKPGVDRGSSFIGHLLRLGAGANHRPHTAICRLAVFDAVDNKGFRAIFNRARSVPVSGRVFAGAPAGSATENGFAEDNPEAVSFHLIMQAPKSFEGGL